jgi:predicted patatin/cPLA2 family phospholipase
MRPEQRKDNPTSGFLTLFNNSGGNRRNLFTAGIEILEFFLTAQHAHAATAFLG